jgi:hypothetical protein
MDQKAAAPARAGKAQAAKPHARSRSLWRRVRQPLVNSDAFKQAVASLLAGFLRFVRRTNRVVEGSCDIDAAIAEHTPAVIALWHGQHLVAPAFNP